MGNQIFIPELIAAGVSAKLGDAIKLYPIAYKKDLGVSTGGDTVTLPKTAYIGDAAKVLPGVKIPVTDFTQSTDSVKVAKYGKSLKFTEEDVLSAYTDVQSEAENQLIKSVASGIETEMFAALKAIKAPMTHTSTKTVLEVEEIGQALVKFGEDLDGEKYLLVNPAEFAGLRKDPNFVVKSSDKVDSVGEVFGCTVVVSARVAAKEAFIVKPEALAIYLKKNVLVEAAKDISDQSHLVVGTTHAAVHLRDEAGAIKIKLA